MIDTLCDQAGERDITVICFYFDFAVQNDQSAASTMGALLKQVVGGLEEIPEEISQAYQKQKKALGGRGPRLSDIVKMLQTTSSKERTFICIDALDECVPEHRAKLIDSLGQILEKSPATRIFVTGRPHIQPEMTRRLAGRVTSLPISTKRDDIIRYLHSRLEEDIIPDAMDSSLEAEILKKVPEDVSEMYVETTLRKLPQACTDRYIPRFLLVRLNIDVVLQETTIHRRRQKLNAMTDSLGLGDAYGATLDRVKRQGGERARLGVAALMWISHAERPLTADELCHALAIEIGSPNLNTDNIPSIGTLLTCCQGLVVVEKEASTVRLIHFTLQEYLRAHPDLFGPTHSTIAEICLTYLNSQQVRAFSTNPSSDPQHAPFLEYSSLYWGVHAKRDLSDRAKLLALKLFNDHNNHMPTKTLFQAQKPYWHTGDFGKIWLFSGLHYASFFGIVEIVASLVEIEGCDINQMDFRGSTPLVWAARNGHEGVVNTLLEQKNINPDKTDNNGESPLSGAALNGHEGVVKILLGREDVNPDKSDNDGHTSLHCATMYGHEGVVKTLLGRDDIDPDKSDNDGRTPLSWAASNGHEGVVKVLLARDDVNPDKSDNDGRTPFWWAASKGHEGVVKILLGRDDIDPDKSDNNGQTPLWCAAFKGYEGVVKILLERDDVNPDKLDNNGGTPLWCAACSGHEGVVKILLERDDVNPDKPDNDGRTPLSCAASNGHEGVVKVLLARDDVNPDKSDNNGRAPLYWTAYNGHEGVVKMLLERDDVNPDKPNNSGQTPTSGASFNGHEGVVKILLGRDDIDPDNLDNDGRTPLWWAAYNGHEGVVNILLARDDVNPNKLDEDGKTPFDWATEEGHQGVVTLLQPLQSAAAPNLS